MGAMTDAGPVVLFDGVCNLCNGAVQLILDNERDASLHFAALQSEAAAKLLANVTGESEARALRAGATGSGEPDSVVLVEDGRVYTCSTAAIRMARYLRAPWSWARVFALVPRPVRDAAYRFIARHRYRWFGRTETCRVPTPALKARFLT